MPKKSYANIKVLPGWLEKLEIAKQEIIRQEELNGLYAWQTGGAYTDGVRNRWQQYYNRSFSPQHRYIIYCGIDNNDFAIWLETKLIQWSQDRGTGVKQGRIAILNTTEYSANRTGCVYMVAINQDKYVHIILEFFNIIFWNFKVRQC